MPTEMSVRELYALTKEGTQLEKDQLEYVQLQGWIRTNRAGKNEIAFAAQVPVISRCYQLYNVSS